MSSSGMLHRVALVRTDVSEERSSSIIGVKRIGDPESMLAVPSVLRLSVTANVVPSSPTLVTLIMGGHTFFRNVGSDKSHTA
jgi:hypothetical protein